MTSLFDIVLIIPLVLALFRGYRKGFIIEAASLIALFLGVIVGLKFAQIVGEQLSYFGIITQYNEIIAFVILMVLVVIAVHFIAKFMEGFVKIVFLGFANKLLGSVFSMLKMGLILSLVLFVIHVLDKRIGFLGEDFRNESKLYMPMVDFVYKGIPYVKELSKPLSEPEESESEEIVV